MAGIGKPDPQVGQLGDIAPDHDRVASVDLRLYPAPRLIRILGLLTAGINVQSLAEIQLHIGVTTHQVHGRCQAGIAGVHERQAAPQAEDQAFTRQPARQLFPAEVSPVQQVPKGA